MLIKKRLFKSIAAIVALLFLFTGCSLSELLGGAPDGRNTIPFAKMKYTRPDGDAMLEGADELIQKAKDAANYNELIKVDNEFGQLILPLYTAYTLAELKTYMDVTDEYFEEEYRYCDDLYVEVSNKITAFNAVVIEGPYAADYEKDVGEYLFQNMKDQLLLDSEEVAPLKKERNSINTDYNNALNEMTFEYNGKTVTYDGIWDIADSQETLYRLLREYYKQNAKQFTEYYKSIVDLDKEVAYTLGFESAADYYYLSYSRDYTPEDAMQYAEYSKELFVPLYATESIRKVSMDERKSFNKLPDVLEEIDPTLREAWDFMIKYDLYDFEARENKNENVAFQTEIYEYDAPFIYGYWDDTTGSLSTLTHEFGHFYDSWLDYGREISSVFNLDIAESYSQGLELLVSFKYNEFTNSHKRAQQYQLYDFLNPLVWQIALEEFSQEAYKLDTFDADVIAKLYADIMKEYQLDSGMVDENGRDYSWYRVTHLFDAPFYTVSYWTSASVALQIWSAANDDYNKGVELYLNMINSEQNQPFKSLVAGAGLKDPGDPETMKQVAIDLAQALELDLEDYPALAA